MAHQSNDNLRPLFHIPLPRHSNIILFFCACSFRAIHVLHYSAGEGRKNEHLLYSLRHPARRLMRIWDKPKFWGCEARLAAPPCAQQTFSFRLVPYQLLRLDLKRRTLRSIQKVDPPILLDSSTPMVDILEP